MKNRVHWGIVISIQSPASSPTSGIPYFLSLLIMWCEWGKSLKVTGGEGGISCMEENLWDGESPQSTSPLPSRKENDKKNEQQNFG